MPNNWYEDFTLWWSYARIPLFTFVMASFGMTWFIILRFGRSIQYSKPNVPRVCLLFTSFEEENHSLGFFLNVKVLVFFSFKSIKQQILTSVRFP